MNCPKTLRNGPCGGVRANGNCEIKPDMACVWVKAWEGSTRMANNNVHVVQFAVNNQLKGRSSWLAVARDKNKDAELQDQPATSTKSDLTSDLKSNKAK